MRHFCRQSHSAPAFATSLLTLTLLPNWWKAVSKGRRLSSRIATARANCPQDYTTNGYSAARWNWQSGLYFSGWTIKANWRSCRDATKTTACWAATAARRWPPMPTSCQSMSSSVLSGDQDRAYRERQRLITDRPQLRPPPDA